MNVPHQVFAQVQLASFTQENEHGVQIVRLNALRAALQAVADAAVLRVRPMLLLLLLSR
jgi:hypothetical protein